MLDELELLEDSDVSDFSLLLDDDEDDDDEDEDEDSEWVSVWVLEEEDEEEESRFLRPPKAAALAPVAAPAAPAF